MKVLVYLIPTVRPTNTKSLEDFFKSNDFFTLIKLPFNKKKWAFEDYFTKGNMIYEALSDARKKHKSNYIITIEETSVTSSDAFILQNLIEEIVRCDCSQESISSCSSDKSENENRSCSCEKESGDCSCCSDLSKSRECCDCYKKCKWDIAYLADWLDKCELFEKVDKKSKDLIKWVKTKSPNGTQALLWSPRGRDIVLGKKCMKNGNYFPPLHTTLSNQLNINIENGNLRALTTTPYFFFFDVNLAKTAYDLQKLCGCSEVEEVVEETTPVVFTIFVVLVTLVVSLAWLSYTMWGKYY